MKKCYTLLLTTLFLFVSYNNLYAEDDINHTKAENNRYSISNDWNLWFAMGYSYTIPDAQELNSIFGPISTTFGFSFLKFFAFDLTFSGRFNYTTLYDSLKEEFESYELKPYLLFQPKLGDNHLALMPYIGIGPSFYLIGSRLFTKNGVIEKTLDSDISFDVGFSAKAGLRLQAVQFLFLGIGTEYLYHKGAAIYKNGSFDDNANLSGWSVGLEVGVIF